MPRNLLTDAQCRNAARKAAGYRLADGDGLFLVVTPAAVKSWVLRYRDGKGSQTATLGRYPTLSLGAAREERDQLAALAAAENHLTEHKRAKKRERTTVEDGLFRNVAADWRQREGRRMQWAPDYATEVERSIDNHLGDLLKLHVAKIDAPTVARVLAKVDRDSVSMSKKVRTRVRVIFDHAITEGLITLSPVPATRRRTAGAKRNYPAVTDRDGVGKILRDARKSDVCRGIKRAHEIIAVTAQRSGEIVPAEWAEFDLDSDAPTWTIPRSRMKMKKGERGDHLVPLPPGLSALLKLWKAEDGDGAVYVCPARAGRRRLAGRPLCRGRCAPDGGGAHREGAAGVGVTAAARAARIAAELRKRGVPVRGLEMLDALLDLIEDGLEAVARFLDALTGDGDVRAAGVAEAMIARAGRW